ncbi:hypothetical protein DAH51_26945 [Sphingobium yanoikuyae]|uniref:Uncharacterized protein n=1 Tax=Sphingobium yanoikuyae TaxID=13690 RepID=A0A430BBB8_SPHYA|nr:hypothetical protein DAH51_26945 [Sphingobium yanoikuyae]
MSQVAWSGCCIAGRRIRREHASSKAIARDLHLSRKVERPVMVAPVAHGEIGDHHIEDILFRQP